MKLTSRILCAVLAAAALCSSKTWAAEEAAPLECPQCGAWTLTWSKPPGLVGERLVANYDRISIPMCGEFRPEVESSSIKNEEGGSRRYRLSFALRGAGIASCATKKNDVDALRVEVDISVAYRRDGGFGDFVIIDRATGTKVFAASGWNYERDNPCDTGSGRGSLACVVVANAGLQRQLSQSALLANPNYRVGRVLRAAEHACRNKGQDAGGSWPAVWQESCKADLLAKKFEAFTAFHECREKQGRSCQVPDERVGRSTQDTP